MCILLHVDDLQHGESNFPCYIFNLSPTGVFFFSVALGKSTFLDWAGQELNMSNTGAEFFLIWQNCKRALTVQR